MAFGHKSWLSKADFTRLIVISHKVCWIPYYDIAWLIVHTWLSTCKLLLYYNWLIGSWVTIVMSYDVMTFTHDSHYESWVSPMWLIWAQDLVYGLWLVNGLLYCDSYELWDGFDAMTHYESLKLCYAGWWVTKVSVVGRCLCKGLGSDHERGSSRNHLSTFLDLR